MTSPVRCARPPGRSAVEPPAIRSPQGSIRATNPVQRDANRSCLDCGRPIVRARRARGPLPLRCLACAAARQPRIQVRAYLRSAARLADELGLADVALAARAAVAALDAAGVAR